MKFKHWVTSKVLPSIRKYGQYRLFDNPDNKMFKIETETHVYYKLDALIRKRFPDTTTIAQCGENQDMSYKGIGLYENGYTGENR